MQVAVKEGGWHLFEDGCIFEGYTTLYVVSAPWFMFRTLMLIYLLLCTQDVARFCNRYPNIDLTFEVQNKDHLYRYIEHLLDYGAAFATKIGVVQYL